MSRVLETCQCLEVILNPLIKKVLSVVTKRKTFLLFVRTYLTIENKYLTT